MSKRHITENEIQLAKKVDIAQLLENNGHELNKKGRTSICSSPFSSDSTPSFVVYTDQNRFYDFSTGNSGDAISLALLLFNIEFPEAVCLLNGDKLPLWDEKVHKKKIKKKKPFNIDNYTTTVTSEVTAIDTYARYRGITNNYMHGVYYIMANDSWKPQLSIMFPHKDLDGNITGAKFRNIAPVYNFDRFSARGVLNMYICDNFFIYGEDDIYIVEGEANCNSLNEFFVDEEVYCSVMSFGGVGQIPKQIPETSGKTYIIIDYDADEEMYNERIRAYSHLNAIPIKMILPKGEDINSLWMDGEIEILRDMLL